MEESTCHEYDFHVDAERMIVKNARNVKKMVLKKYCMARYLFLKEELPICEGYGQLN